MPELLSRTCLCACNCNVPVVTLSACFGLVLRPFLHDPPDKKKEGCVTSLLLCVVDACVSVLVKLLSHRRYAVTIEILASLGRAAYTYVSVNAVGRNRSVSMDALHKNNTKTAVVSFGNAKLRRGHTPRPK